MVCILLLMGPKRSLTPEQEQAVVTRYQAGEHVNAIARDLGVSAQTAHNTLARYDIPKRPDAIRRRLTPKQRTLVVAACREGKKVPEVAKLFQVSESNITKALRLHRQAGGVVEMRRGRPPEHELNHGAFDVLTPEALYWMGFLFTDGCVHQDDYGAAAIIIGLAECDREHLEKFRSFLGSTHAITRTEKTRTSKGGPCVYFRVRSQRIAGVLARHGVVTKRTRVPSPELANSRDFWRGAVDGDGWIGTTDVRGYVYPAIMLCGQRLLLTAFGDYLRRNNLADLRIAKANQAGVPRIETSGSTATSIVYALYERATVALERKHARAIAIMEGRLEQIVSYK